MKQSAVDVLIIGAGPAGLTTALWLARCGISTLIIDKRATGISCGHADGLEPRTWEILDSFGLATPIWEDSNKTVELCLWNPTPDSSAQIQRTSVRCNAAIGVSRYQEATMTQARIEGDIINHLSKFPNVKLQRNTIPRSIHAELGSFSEYPLHVMVESASAVKPERNGHAMNGATNGAATDHNREDGYMINDEELIRAKYVVGCDGAHSWTRKQLGIEMKGKSSQSTWGVVDIVPRTDFPDIRKRCIVQSAHSGTLMIIPREKKLVRLYVDLASASTHLDASNATPQAIVDVACKILSPYKLSYSICDWWTIYTIGQRLATSYSGANNRIFLAGDAVHTHSAKAGQGMNLSMQDGYNLGWKLAYTLNGLFDPSILHTYESERRPIAQHFITYDEEFARSFCTFNQNLCNGIKEKWTQEFEQKLDAEHGDIGGLSVNYDEIVRNGCKVSLGSDGADEKASPAALRVGMRFPDHQVVNQVDASPVHLQRRLTSNGKWRLVVFAGNMAAPSQKARVASLAGFLASRADALLLRGYHVRGIGAPMEIITVHSSPRRDVEFEDIPELFRPWDDEEGWSYDSVFVDGESYHEGHGRAYERYGVDAERGCVVLVRPDQHVALIEQFEDAGKLVEFMVKLR